MNDTKTSGHYSSEVTQASKIPTVVLYFLYIVDVPMILYEGSTRKIAHKEIFFA